MSAPNDQGRMVFGPPPGDDGIGGFGNGGPPHVVVPARDYTPAEKAARQKAADDEARLKREAMRVIRREQLAAMMRSVISDLFILAGVAGLTFAGFTVAVWLGATIGSIGLIIVGVAIDPPVWRRDKQPTTEGDK